jgi:hypothetical protein
MHVLPNPNHEATPEQKPEDQIITAWDAMQAAYIDATVGTLEHASVCPQPQVKLQGFVLPQTASQKKHHAVPISKFRVICQCGSAAELPTDPDWARAWGLHIKRTIVEAMGKGGAN